MRILGATTYASLFSYPFDFAEGKLKNTAGQVTGFNYGNGVAAIFGYSAERGQLTSLKYTQGAATLFHLSYGYTQGGGNNGQITSITDNVESGRTATYTRVYPERSRRDGLARLKTAGTTGSANYAQWGLEWTNDRYGNRTAQTLTAGKMFPDQSGLILIGY